MGIGEDEQTLSLRVMTYQVPHGHQALAAASAGPVGGQPLMFLVSPLGALTETSAQDVRLDAGGEALRCKLGL
jgi:hypothetical protein